MGLTMYLRRANLHGYSLQQAQAASNYYNEMENKKKRLWHRKMRSPMWSDIDDSFLDMEAVKDLRCEYRKHYITYDTGKKMPIWDVFEYVGYWRKAYVIHDWFVENVQDGEDDYEVHAVSKEQLEELRTICKDILSGKTRPEDTLPDYHGLTPNYQEYGEDYMYALQTTVEILDKLFAQTNWETQTIFYQGS